MRLLLISYYFPPCGGAAVQRWHKWLPDLVQRGYQITVLTTRDGDYPVRDESLLAEIPPEVRIIRTRTLNSGRIWRLLLGSKSSVPYGDLSAPAKGKWLHRLLVWIRLNLIIPDLRRFWNPQAYRAAEKYLRENPTDMVITTGPPHSTHLIGLKLKQRFKISWVADWRDPWTSIYYLQLNPPTALSRYLLRKMETKVAETADLNLVVSQHLACQLPARNTQVIYNGFDARKFETLDHYEKQPVFRIKYVGKVTEGQKFEALVTLIAEALQRLEYEITFVGAQLSEQQNAILQKAMPGRYKSLPWVTHQIALQEMTDAEVLLLLINYYEGSEGMLTTKLFEYVASGTKILCLGPHGGEAEQIIWEYEAGSCYDTNETAAASEYLRLLYADWKQGKDLKNAKDVSALSSQNQVVKLLRCLESVKKD